MLSGNNFKDLDIHTITAHAYDDNYAQSRRMHQSIILRWVMNIFFANGRRPTKTNSTQTPIIKNEAHRFY